MSRGNGYTLSEKCSGVSAASARSNAEGLQKYVVNTQSEDTEVCTKEIAEISRFFSFFFNNILVTIVCFIMF